MVKRRMINRIEPTNKNLKKSSFGGLFLLFFNKKQNSYAKI